MKIKYSMKNFISFVSFCFLHVGWAIKCCYLKPFFKRFFQALFVCSLSACVSYDPLASRSFTDVELSKDLSGIYLPKAKYFTHDGFLAAETMADLVGVGNTDADEVRITQGDGPTLHFVWLKDGVEKRKALIGPNEGLKNSAEGGLEWDAKKGFLPKGAGDPASFGFNNATHRYFKNVQGDLVVLQTGNAGGMFLIIPVVIVTKHISMFSQKR
jgi:hypothetical protein